MTNMMAYYYSSAFNAEPRDSSQSCGNFFIMDKHANGPGEIVISLTVPNEQAVDYDFREYFASLEIYYDGFTAYR